MPVFLATPRDRIRALSALVERHLQQAVEHSPATDSSDEVRTQRQRQAALRSLLMARYFEAVSEPGSVVLLLSVLDDPQFDNSDDSDLNRCVAQVELRCARM